MNFIPEPFDLSASLSDWLMITGILLGVALTLGLLFSFIVGGLKGPQLFWTTLVTGSIDLTHLSFRRIWAIATLTFRQAVRRKALLVFVIFALLFMFAGWFLSDTNDRADLEVKVYISFVLTAVTWLILPVVLILSCWGIPEDIKARSLHTVVTKPVRRSEIVLGRIFGFGMIGTLILLIMSSIGYLWIIRQVPEKSQYLLTCRVPLFGRLSFLDSEGNPGAGVNVGDAFTIRKSGFINGQTRECGIFTFDGVTKDFGDAINLESRFEAYRSYKGKVGQDLQAEIRIVKELRERTALALGASYSKFSTLTSAIRTEKYLTVGQSLMTLADRFEKGEITPRLTPDWISIANGYEDFARVMNPFSKIEDDAEWTSEVTEAARNAASAARTAPQNKSPEERTETIAAFAKAMRSIAQSFQDHPDEYKNFLVDRVYRHPAIFVKEFTLNSISINRNLTYSEDGKKKDGDLYKDLVHGEELQFQVYCLDRNQLLGMARPDFLILKANRPFYHGYFKAVFAIWLMVILTITFSVTASCFLKGPVATFAILTVLVLGSPFHNFLEKLSKGESFGGGVVEATTKMIDQSSIMADYKNETGLKIDHAVIKGLRGVYKVIPNLNSLSMSERVANGFDVPMFEKEKAIVPSVLMTFGFLFPCVILAYFSLKLRELETK